MCPELVPERTLKKFLFSVSVTYEQCAFRAKMTVHASRLSGVPVQLDLRVIIYIVKIRCGHAAARAIPGSRCVRLRGTQTLRSFSSGESQSRDVERVDH